MTKAKLGKPIALIAAGIGLLAIGSGFAYWHLSQRQWCVQFTSRGGQEVTYSRGCMNPQRYKKWVITASTANLPTSLYPAADTLSLLDRLTPPG